MFRPYLACGCNRAFGCGGGEADGGVDAGGAGEDVQRRIVRVFLKNI